MSDIFISYAEEDSALAGAIAQGLEQVGFTTWYYERDSLPGTPWLTQVGTEIEHASAVVLLISRHSLASQQVTSEVDYARSKGKPFVPVQFGVTHEDIQRRQLQWAFALGTIVAITVPEDGLTEWFFTRLAKGLQNLGVRVGERPPEAGDLDGRLADAQRLANDPQRRVAAERALRQIAADYPTSARVFRALGGFFSQSFRVGDAIAAYETAAGLEPGSALAHWDLGVAYESDGRASEAAACLNRSLDLGLDPKREALARTLLRKLGSRA